MADTRWQVPDLPEPDIQAALGRVAVRHGFLCFVLIRTVKTLGSLELADADQRFARCGFQQLYERVERDAIAVLGKDNPATIKLLDMLREAKRLTELRNMLVHGLWAQDVDTEERMIIIAGASRAPPTLVEIDQLANDILAVATAINHGRLNGFLQEALRIPAATSVPTASPSK